MLKIRSKNIVPFKSVFVLGGTSDISKEICLNLAKKGVERFHLVSKNTEKNQLFINELRKSFKVKVTSEEVNILNYNFDQTPVIGYFDLYIIAIGYLGDSKLASSNIDEANKIAKINFYGLIPWINEITSDNRISKPGACWILSSVAGDKGRPSNYHYGAAKSALTTFCEGVLHKCHNKPFIIRIIKAGFIDTSMSINVAPKILFVSTRYVANSLLRRPYKKGIEYLPWWWSLIMKIIAILPRFIVSKL